MTENQQLAMLVDFKNRLEQAIKAADELLVDTERESERHHIGTNIPLLDLLEPQAWEWRDTGRAIALVPLYVLLDQINAMIDALGTGCRSQGDRSC